MQFLIASLIFASILVSVCVSMPTKAETNNVEAHKRQEQQARAMLSPKGKAILSAVCLSFWTHV